MDKETKEALKEISEIVMRHNDDISESVKQIEKIWLVIGGDTSLNIQGIIHKQQQEQEFRQKLMSKLDSVKETIHQDSIALNKRMKSLENYTQTIDTVLKITGDKRFWKFIWWIIFICTVSYAVMSDEVKEFINKFKP